mgnify:CR=1 FL=1
MIPQPGYALRKGLNRTSVGLKRWGDQKEMEMRHTTPQSNQRGIETPGSPPTGPLPRRGLNRTSVGLKPVHVDCNRNAYSRLNRTSVGLKLHPPPPRRQSPRPPQSNQRGIETAHGK